MFTDLATLAALGERHRTRFSDEAERLDAELRRELDRRLDEIAALAAGHAADRDRADGLRALLAPMLVGTEYASRLAAIGSRG